MNIVELIQILPEQHIIQHTPSNLKVTTDYDVFLIYDVSETLVAVFTDDLEFANSISYLRRNPHIIQNSFTPSIRCVTIHYNDFLHSISLNELLKRYSTKI